MSDEPTYVTHKELNYYLQANFDVLQHRIERLAKLVLMVASTCGNSDLHIYAMTEAMLILRSTPEQDNELF